MDMDGLFHGMSVSASGLGAERQRLDTIARNIANANVVAGPDGTPYRRQEVMFETVLAEEATRGEGVPGGVRVSSVTSDMATPLKEIHDPTHPAADPKTGLVTYSNVDMVFEMVDLITASKSYEANLRAMSTYRDMVRQSLRLLEG